MDQRRNRVRRSINASLVVSLVVSLAMLLVASCGGGSSSRSSSAGANHAPSISGSPRATIQGGTAYAFVPTASDADGNSLTFQISNRPPWASFDSTTGALTGTPTGAQVGSYANVIISVSDGTASTSLAPFAIAVTQISTGTATISWLPPTQNTDGSTLMNLAGYRIYYGTNAATPSQTVDITNVGLTTYMLQSLTPATWYFTVRSYTATGDESGPSNIASKTIQ